MLAGIERDLAVVVEARREPAIEMDVDVDQYQQDQQRKLLHHVAGIGEVDQLRVILREQVCQDAQDGRGEHLIEAEPNECPEPSPEQKLQLVKDKKRNDTGPRRPTTALAIAPYARWR